MKKILSFVLIPLIIGNFSLPTFAQDTYYQEDKKMTQEDINLYKYKMEKITVKQEHGKWIIVQGINYELTDIQLLKLVNSENIANQRTKDVENKQNLGGAVTIAGIGLGIIGGVFVGNVIKVENGTYYGIAGIVLGLALVAVGNLISPIISDDTDHVINIQEAKDAAELYNSEVRKRLHIKEDVN